MRDHVEIGRAAEEAASFSKTPWGRPPTEEPVGTGRGPKKGVRRDPEREEVQTLFGRVPIAGARVLEIGCGEGRLTRRIAGAARSLVAVDPNAASVAMARRQLPAKLRQTVQFEVGDAETLRFGEGSFDVVLLSWAL